MEPRLLSSGQEGFCRLETEETGDVTRGLESRYDWRPESVSRDALHFIMEYVAEYFFFIFLAQLLR